MKPFNLQSWIHKFSLFESLSLSLCCFVAISYLFFFLTSIPYSSVELSHVSRWKSATPKLGFDDWDRSIYGFVLFIFLSFSLNKAKKLLPAPFFFSLFSNKPPPTLPFSLFDKIKYFYYKFKSYKIYFT